MRRRKWLRRGAVLLGILLVLYIGFWAALFDPLEADVEVLAALIPKDVTYMVHSHWGKLRQSALYEECVAGSPIRDDVEATLELEEYLYRPIREVEEQVNVSLPSFLGEFSILGDVMGKEVLLSGNLRGPGEDIGEKILNSSFVLLTRITTKAKFMEVLKFGFVRDRIPNLTVYRDFFQYDVGVENIRPGAPEEARYFYFARIRDVLVLSNHRELMQRVMHYGLVDADRASDETLPRFWWFYYDWNDSGELPSGAGLSTWLRLGKADGELRGALEGAGRRSEGTVGDLIRAFFPVGLTNTLTLHLGVEGERTFPLEGSIRMIKSDSFPAQLREFHQREGTELRPAIEPWVKKVPLDRTFGFMWLKMDPDDFLLSLFSFLDRGTQEALFGKQGRPGEADGSWTMERTASDLGTWFEEGVGVSWARLPEVDDIDLDTFDGGSPEPIPGSTIYLTEKEQLDPQDLIDYFVRNHEKFGFHRPEEIPSATGRLFKMEISGDLSMGLLKPGFALIDRQFLFSTNHGELTRILETAAGKRKALADGERFGEALSRIQKRGNLFAFVDGRKIRPYLLDQRWQAAFQGSTFDRVNFRKRTIIKLTKQHRDWDPKKLNEEADHLMDIRERTQKDVDFPDEIKKYRSSMFWTEPFDWLGVSTDVAGDVAGRVLELKGALRLLPRDEEVD